MVMAVEPDIAGTAALFGDSSTAAMLTALLDQRSRSAESWHFSLISRHRPPASTWPS